MVWEEDFRDLLGFPAVVLQDWILLWKVEELIWLLMEAWRSWCLVSNVDYWEAVVVLYVFPNWSWLLQASVLKDLVVSEVPRQAFQGSLGLIKNNFRLTVMAILLQNPVLLAKFWGCWWKAFCKTQVVYKSWLIFHGWAKGTLGNLHSCGCAICLAWLESCFFLSQLDQCHGNNLAVWSPQCLEDPGFTIWKEWCLKKRLFISPVGSPASWHDNYLLPIFLAMVFVSLVCLPVLIVFLGPPLIL